MRKRILGAIVALWLVGCADQEKKDFDTDPQRPKILFAEAKAAYDAGKYKTATKDADELVRLYPYAAQAAEAMLLSGESSYRDNRHEAAQAVFKRFVETFPAHPRADYAQYMSGICLYDRLSDPARDQGLTREAERIFNVLIRRYPNSEYVEDARLKLVAIRDHLAAKELDIGRYYLRQNNPGAALQRFRTVTEQYQDTAQVQEALHRIVEASLMLGLREEARRAAAVLGANYPDSRWYADSYALLNAPK